MQVSDRLAPHALLQRSLIAVEVTPAELAAPIETLTTKTMRASDDPEQIDFADFLFCRIAALREASR
jgi:hypothetical protein